MLLTNQSFQKRGLLLRNHVVMGVPVGTPQHFIPKLIDLYRKGLFPFDRLVAFYDFREINTAIDHFHRGAVIKPVLRISEV